jgi:hypothetical protein
VPGRADGAKVSLTRTDVVVFGGTLSRGREVEISKVQSPPSPVVVDSCHAWVSGLSQLALTMRASTSPGAAVFHRLTENNPGLSESHEFWL